MPSKPSLPSSIALPIPDGPTPADEALDEAHRLALEKLGRR
jgi:hypothetical protein